MHQERTLSNASSTAAGQLAAIVPLVEPPGASNRLDNIIHQSDSDDISYSKSALYNLAEMHQKPPRKNSDQSLPREQIVTNISHDEEETEGINTSGQKPNRSNSVSTTASTSARQDTDITPGNSYTLPPKTTATHRSLEDLSRKTSQDEQGLRPSNKANSLEFSQKPVQYDENPGSIYFNTQELPLPAADLQDHIQGYLNKKNIGKIQSIFRTVKFIFFV